MRQLGDPSISPVLKTAPAPLADRAGEALVIVIDGRIRTGEIVELFTAAHSLPEG